jgi:hypothetical protein
MGLLKEKSRIRGNQDGEKFRGKRGRKIKDLK